MQLSRRALVKTGLVTGGAAATAMAAITTDTRPSAAATLPKTNPFKLGVASGDPWQSGVVLWTRLAVSPLAVNGLGGMSTSTYTLAWQVATDTKFTKVVRSGTVAAKYANAHSVHVDVTGLLPGRVYYYRFRLGSYYSRVGRTRTAPAFDTATGSLAMAFVSCSHYEYGYFTAYRRLAEDQPDLVLHLGDYQYEYKGAGPASATSRNHAGPETVTLANYRQRLAQYHTDPDLQAAHAVAPWLVVFDDHEVDNNWADETPENDASVPGFMTRRAAAFKAYYENMPLRRASIPVGPDMKIYRRLPWGKLANFHMLDTRQYRDVPGCESGDIFQDCAENDDPARSLTGAAQEQWLADGFANSRATWDILGAAGVLRPPRLDRDPRQHGLDAGLGRVPGLTRSGDRLLDAGPGPEPDRAHRRRARALGLRGAAGLLRPRLPHRGLRVRLLLDQLRWQRVRRADRPAPVGGVQPQPEVLDQPARLRQRQDHA